MQVSLGSYQ